MFEFRFCCCCSSLLLLLYVVYGWSSGFETHAHVLSGLKSSPTILTVPSPTVVRFDLLCSQVRTESHDTLKSLVDAIIHGSTSEQLKAHALYRWLASQSMPYYAKCKTAKPSSPTGKLRQLADGKICYAALYQEMAKYVSRFVVHLIVFACL